MAGLGMIFGGALAGAGQGMVENARALRDEAMAEVDRSFRREEAEASRGFEAKQSEIERDWRSQEAEAGRGFDREMAEREHALAMQRIGASRAPGGPTAQERMIDDLAMQYARQAGRETPNHEDRLKAHGVLGSGGSGEGAIPYKDMARYRSEAMEAALAENERRVEEKYEEPWSDRELRQYADKLLAYKLGREDPAVAGARDRGRAAVESLSAGEAPRIPGADPKLSNRQGLQVAPPSGGGLNRALGNGEYKRPEDVGEAMRAGLITRKEAERILREQFGME